MCRVCWKWHCCKVLNVSLFPSKRANFVNMRSSVLWHLHHITTDSGLKWPCQLFSSFPLPLIPFNKQTKQKSCSSLQISFAVSCCSDLSAAIKDTIFLYSAVILLRSDRQQTSRPYRIFSLFQLLFFFFISLIWSPAATHPSPSLQMYFFNHTPLHWGYIIITVSIKEFAR